MELTDRDVGLWLSQDAPTLVVCGAGLSVGPPTRAPGVWPFLERTLAALHAAAGYSPDTRYVERLFPETCYGAIGEATGTDGHLRIWEVLGPSTARAVGARPNPAHHLVAALAAARGWPVLTTNFDCFIEGAAAEQNVPCSVVVPTLDPGAVNVACRRGALSLVKLHGTATDHRTVRSTAADLSRCALMVDRLQFAVEPQRLLVIGYSGRDFDLFPWLAASYSDVVWVDPHIPANHRVHTIAGAAWWTGDAVQLSALSGPSEPAGPSEGRTAEVDDVADAYDRAVEAAVSTHVLPVLRLDGVATVALMATLSATGAHRDVLQLAEQYRPIVDDRRRFQALLLEAGSQAHLDRFDDSLRTIEEARRVAVKLRSPRRLARTSIARSYSMTASQWLSIVPGASRRLTAEQIHSLLAVLWTTIVTAPVGAGTVAGLLRSRGTPTANAYRLGCEYIEHLVRLGALLEGLRNRLPLASRALDLLWLTLERTAGAIGYTVGVLNVAKYRSRRDMRTDGPTGAVTRGIALGDLVALTIAYRDAGLAAAESATRADGAAGDVAVHRALDLLDHALEAASELGCPSLLIKTWLARKSAGCGDRISPDDVESLLARTQCAAIRRQHDLIVAAVATSTSRDA